MVNKKLARSFQNGNRVRTINFNIILLFSIWLPEARMSAIIPENLLETARPIFSYPPNRPRPLVTSFPLRSPDPPSVCYIVYGTIIIYLALIQEFTRHRRHKSSRQRWSMPNLTPVHASETEFPEQKKYNNNNHNNKNNNNTYIIYMSATYIIYYFYTHAFAKS